MKFSWIAATAVLSLCAFAVSAQTFPSKPLKLVVPFPPGGPTDAIGRQLTQKMGEALGQPFIVENRPGPGAQLAMGSVVQGGADGHTIFFGSSSLTTYAPYLLPSVQYEPEKVLAPVGRIGGAAYVLVVNSAGIPSRTLKDFIEYSKARPNQLNWSSPGIGILHHLIGEHFKNVTGASFVHIPNKGTAGSILSLLAGDTPVYWDNIFGLDQHIKSGRVTPLVVTSLQRMSQLPNVPTMIESGYPGFDLSAWWGFFVPAGTPSAAVARLNLELNKALAAPDFVKWLDTQGGVTQPTTPEEFGAFWAGERVRFAKIVKDVGLRAN
jgi:tripartite-type tricarboxylate transporter receptor subunit TctC